ncbi:PREDICTED: von Willebrand factor A domain-containing protein 9-like [Priapulus caudatus]|uniref:Integrator complex subunit 14 n=1 Tax=Priapulus caudatus TaxID=37621 RepID=A0ABM1EZZ9_PRICU|nr:PREDICTED: von Willebrand factor A domain-containing protein 9-like [Priapulus caudatus]
MPTVVLLDVSLSMCRTVSSSEEYQRHNLALHGLNTLLDYVATHQRLEFTSLVQFSSLWEVLVPFTRDYDKLKAALTSTDSFDKTFIETVLSGITPIVIEEWGANIPCQIVLVTDGTLGVGQGSLPVSVETRGTRAATDPPFPLPFPFPSQLHVVLLAEATDSYLQNSLSTYRKLIECNNGAGSLSLPEGELSLSSVQKCFTMLAETHFSSFHSVLRCGHLTSNVNMFPPPQPHVASKDLNSKVCMLSTDIEICGFIDLADAASPAIISRHLVLPLPPTKLASKEAKKEVESGDTDEEETDVDVIAKTPSFCVLLHGSLKVESMTAICQVGEDWYGMLYSWADTKKKSNLMLSVFEPGVGSVPWLGRLDRLGPLSDFAEAPYGNDDARTPFPVKPAEAGSYARSCVVWIKQSGLQTDIQKVLRHARKLPEKMSHFYKELNRVRKAALAFGFLELLEGLSVMLERECTMLPGTAHPAAPLQLTHAAGALRSARHDYHYSITPLRTNFASEDS